MTRVSLAEAYDNKDVISQIYRLMDRVDDSTYKGISVTRSGNNIVFTFTLNNDDTKTFEVPDEGITDVSGTTSGSQVTITFTFTDGTTKDFTYTATGGVTVDTEQTVTGKKTFNDIKIAGAVDGDVLVDGEVTADGAEIAHMAIEESGSKTVISNENGITVNGHDLNNVATTNESNLFVPTQIFQTNPVIRRTGTDWTDQSTSYKATGAINVNDSNNRNCGYIGYEHYGTDQYAYIRVASVGADGTQHGAKGVTAHVDAETGNARVAVPVYTDMPSDSAVNKGYVESTDGTTNNLVHRTADESIAGNKTSTGKWDRKTTLHAKGEVPSAYWENGMNDFLDKNNDTLCRNHAFSVDSDGNEAFFFRLYNTDSNGNDIEATLRFELNKNKSVKLRIIDTNNTWHTIAEYAGE